VLVLKRPEFRICAVVEGHEDEGFLSDLHALADTVKAGPSGANRTTEQSLRELLDSGKYEGIDYGKSDAKLRQSRLFQNTAFGLIRKAKLRPLVMVFDDLQWADPSSLALLQYVARNLRGSDAHLLGTYRVEEGSVRPHLRDALHRMGQEGLVAEIDLGGLSRRDLGLLAESFIGPHRLPEPFLDLLWQETRGNPLIVREVLRGLEEEEAIQVHGAAKKLIPGLGELSIPHRVREAVRARLDRVPRGDRRLLEAAATCGTRFTTAMVARLVGEAEGKVLNGFGAIAGARGFLREGESGFAFDHPAVQEVLYEEMAEDVRLVYHREAADWLELAGGPAEDVAEHLYRARDPRAVGRLRQAAETARTRYANTEAIRFYTEALDIERDPQQRSEVLESLGSILNLMGAFDRAAESFLAASELAGDTTKKAENLARLGLVQHTRGESENGIELCSEALTMVSGESSKAAALAFRYLGIMEGERGQYDEALEHFRRSLAICERIGDDPGVAAALLRIGVVHKRRGHYDEALEHYRGTIAACAKMGDQRGVANALGNIGNVLREKGDHEEALAHLQRSLTIFERFGDKPSVAAALGNMGTVEAQRGRFDEALEYFQRNLAACEAMGEPRSIAIAVGNIGNLHCERGDYDQALAHLRKSLAIFERIGDQRGVANELVNVGKVLGSQGHYDEALEHLAKGEGIFRRIGDQFGVVTALGNIGMVSVERGRYKDALMSLKEGLRLADAIGARSLAGEIQVGIAEVHASLGNVGEGAHACARAISIGQELGSQTILGTARKVAGIISRERGLWDDAVANFEASLSTLAAAGSRPEMARAHLEFGLMWMKKGDTEKARWHVCAAVEAFAALGMGGNLMRAEGVLGALQTGI